MKTKQICELNTLLDWIAKRILEKEPQRPIDIGYVATFLRLVSDLKSGDFSHAFTPRGLLETMGSQSGRIKSYAYLPQLLTDISDLNHEDLHDARESTVFDDVVGFVDFMDQELGSRLRFTRIDEHQTRIKSTLLLKKREGVTVDVHFKPDWLDLLE